MWKRSSLRRAGKRSFLIIVSEAFPELGEALKKRIDSTTKALAEAEGNDRLWVETKFCRMAHIVRGGTPSLADRLLASKMGNFAVDLLLDGKSNLIVIEKAGEIISADIGYTQVLDRMYKGTLKEGMLDKYTAEQIAAMEAEIAVKKEIFAKTYAMFETLSE